MTALAAITRGQLPTGLSLNNILDPHAHPGLVQRELTKSIHANVHLLEGGYVLRSYVSEKRGPLAPNVIEVFDMQEAVGDHPNIETPFFAYQEAGRELFLTKYRDIQNNVILTPKTLSKILGALLHMDIKGVMHGDLGDFNIGEDQNGDPFIYDFDKAHCVNWHRLNINPEAIAFFFLNPPSTVQSEPFNIDLFQNYFLFDQLVMLEEAGRRNEARELYKIFLQYSIGYFIKIKASLQLPGPYSVAIDQRIAAIKKILNNPALLQSTYEDKMLTTFVGAHSWASREVAIRDRNELAEYLELARKRMETWILNKRLGS